MNASWSVSAKMLKNWPRSTQKDQVSKGRLVKQLLQSPATDLMLHAARRQDDTSLCPNFISNSPCCFNKHPCHYFVAVSGHNHIKARVYCPSKAACSGFTLGCSWVCPGISFSQSEKSLITEKVTFSHPLNVYTLCKPIGGGQTFTWFYVLN